MRAGKWKLIFPNRKLPLKLIDLDADIHEDTNRAEQHPDVVARLTKLADLARDELGDGKRRGAGQRPAGLVQKATPRLLSR